jgi:hypothetical protein
VRAPLFSSGPVRGSGTDKFADSLLEGSGFEISVPRQIGNGFEALSGTGSERPWGAAVSSKHLPALGREIDLPRRKLDELPLIAA